MKNLIFSGRLLEYTVSDFVHHYSNDFEVEQKVRKTIQELGGEMPENLPAIESIKKIQGKKFKQIESKD
jgi:hypothetical protein